MKVTLKFSQKPLTVASSSTVVFKGHLFIDFAVLLLFQTQPFNIKPLKSLPFMFLKDMQNIIKI